MTFDKETLTAVLATGTFAYRRHPNSTPEREATIIWLRFCTEQQHTYKEIGEQLGLSGNRVWQITMRSLRVLRHPKRQVFTSEIPKDSRLFRAVFGDKSVSINPPE